ncbi:hypothetical protein D9758_014773 [Tetrapyrgos nigripes]|uniref:Cullin family profile domain-containing protein n=1 Tax=Tetrapyrgos nigripes TaxID=182062 RepID=A0A8H5C4W3_9AGAR|nr:hypothetical protein D9758_014773 [Tetrapyrgos nigripes]
MGVFTLLELPRTSTGFSANITATGIDEGSGSPLRKVARLDNDLDSASASRPSASSHDPIRLDIVGEDNRSKSQTANPANDFALVRAYIRSILSRKDEATPNETYETIYSKCRSLVTVNDYGERLYDALSQLLEQFIDAALSKELISSDKKDVDWISFFVEICDWFQDTVQILQFLLTHLNQVYISSDKNLQTIRELTFSRFNAAILGSVAIHERLVEGVTAWANFERENNTAHSQRKDISALFNHLMVHSQYSAFEEHYIALTRSFYADESQRLAGEGDAERFFQHVQNRIQDEVQRATEVFSPTSWSIIRETTEQALLDGRLEWLANSNLGPYMTAKDFVKLSEMYRLFGRVDGQKVLCDAFRVHVTEKVKSIVKDPSQDDNMVQLLLDLRTLAEDAINTCFVDSASSPDDDAAAAAAASVPNSPSSSTTSRARNKSAAVATSATPTSPTASTSNLKPPTQTPNKDFFYAHTDAFTQGFKARRSKPAEMIARYLDKAMRKGQGTQSTKEYEGTLDKVLGLYRYSEDKDVFRTFYHRQLAKRLLIGKSASWDVEQKMVRDLRSRYDPEFDLGESMFNDLKLSEDLMREHPVWENNTKKDELKAKYKKPEQDTQKKNKDIDVDKMEDGLAWRREYTEWEQNKKKNNLTVMVLQRSAWPFNVQKKKIILSSEMHTQLAKYEQFYKSKHGARVLDWDHALGTVTLTARFKEGEKELSLSLYQAVLLLLFNDRDEIPFTEIAEISGMDDEELRRTLQSLACGKKRVLSKVPPGRDVDDADVFKFNGNFTDPRTRVHISSIQAKITNEESKQTNLAIEIDRKHILDAAIVRIMKAKKELTYEKIKLETIDAVKNHFIPSVEMIKKSVDWLLQNDYLERNEEDRNVFLYVA